MKLYTLMIITAVIAFIFGLGFILVPVSVVGLYGNTLEGVGVFIARYLGAALLGLSFLAWSTRKETDREVQVGFFFAMVLGLIVSLYDAIAGTHNILVWLNVLIYLLLGLGFGYYAFVKKI